MPSRTTTRRPNRLRRAAESQGDDMQTHRQVVEAYFSAVRAHDFPALSDIRHDDFIQEWHQMGERSPGKQNARLINENHPGLPMPTTRPIHYSPTLSLPS